jgi:hypothetical protein
VIIKDGDRPHAVRAKFQIFSLRYSVRFGLSFFVAPIAICSKQHVLSTYIYNMQ